MRAAALAFCCLFGTLPLIAQTFPTGFSRVQVGGVISNPTAMAFAGDGRIFVTEQGGAVRVIKDGSQLAAPFALLTVNFAGERGLIGIALDPDFSSNNYIYLYYTVATAPIHNRISRFTANGDVALAGSEQVLLELDNLSSATNHNGGALGFGPDGKLYVAVGENANGAFAQDLDTYHGKFLRINKDGSAPPDNPFNSGTEQRKRIWSYGLRNPYTFSIQPGTGRIFVNDVGQSSAEEVNDASAAGRNFGWPTTEGPTTNPLFTAPVYAYFHAVGSPTGCAITGGTFFNPSATTYPTTYQNKYFFMDFCSSWIYFFDPVSASPSAVLFGSNVGGSSLSIMTGPDGSLYYLSRGASRLYRLAYTPPPLAPAIMQQPSTIYRFVGETALFTVVATGAQPLAYRWQKNEVDLAGATQSTLQLPNVQLSDAGNYRVIVSNTEGTATSNTASLIVTIPPVAPVITAQPLSLTVEEGQPAFFGATASGTLPLAYHWQKDGQYIALATQSEYAIPQTQESDGGEYRVVVTNPAGTVTSNAATLIVTPANQGPTAAISSPTGLVPYTAGTTISFAGDGTDPEDGVLPASAFEWRINFHHDLHVHDQPAITGVQSGTFDIPDRGETSHQVWYRFILTVRDSKGLIAKDSVDISPAISELTFATNPAGMELTLDGQPITSPQVVFSVEGLLRDVDAPSPQIVQGVEYQFSSWSSGGAAQQSIRTPPGDTAYMATFVPVLGARDAETVHVYPVPATTKLYLNWGGEQAPRLRLIDPLGREHPLKGELTGGVLAVDVSHLPAAVYLLVGEGEEASHAFRVRIAISR